MEKVIKTLIGANTKQKQKVRRRLKTGLLPYPRNIMDIANLYKMMTLVTLWTGRTAMAGWRQKPGDETIFGEFGLPFALVAGLVALGLYAFGGPSEETSLSTSTTPCEMRTDGNQ